MGLLAAGMGPGQAGRAAGVSKSFAYQLHRKMGGVYRPPRTTYSDRYLDREERYELARLRDGGCSLRAIAQRMGRAASTISRELARNADPAPAGIGPSGRTGWPGSGSGGPGPRSWPAARCCGRGCSSCWTAGTPRSRSAGG